MNKIVGSFCIVLFGLSGCAQDGQYRSDTPSEGSTICEGNEVACIGGGIAAATVVYGIVSVAIIGIAMKEILD